MVRFKVLRGPHEKLSLKRAAVALYFLILAIPFFVLYFLISSVSNPSTALAKSSYLTNEGDFLKTLKECIILKGRKCKQYIPKGTSRQRIAVLSPPGSDVEAFFVILRKAIGLYYGSEDVMQKKLELYQSSHVPPYGYGETHGITKIVRVINGPLIKQAVDVILKDHERLSLGNLFSRWEKNKNGFFGTVQQIIRWHCRLNHVSSHTFLWNIYLDREDISHQASKLVERIVSNVEENPQMDFRHLDRMKQVDMYLLEAFKNPLSKLNFQVGQIISIQVLDDVQRILRKELNDANDLKRWPCLSFWDVKGIDSSAVVKNTAKKLGPDCKAKYSKCLVKTDLCEERGDIACSN